MSCDFLFGVIRDLDRYIVCAPYGDSDCAAVVVGGVVVAGWEVRVYDFPVPGAWFVEFFPPVLGYAEERRL